MNDPELNSLFPERDMIKLGNACCLKMTGEMMDKGVFGYNSAAGRIMPCLIQNLTDDPAKTCLSGPDGKNIESN